MIDSTAVLVSLIVLVFAIRKMLTLERKKPGNARQGQRL
jgi:hypothetical protein